MNGTGSRAAAVAVLMGGWSGEREVSLATGRAVLDALKRLGYRCWCVDVGRDLAAVLKRRRPDLAFIALHGRGGEDGTVQGLLETMGIAYTGSGVLASALAMDKKCSKWLFERHGLPTPPWRLARAGEQVGAGDLPFGFPAVVKPSGEGSTIGVSIVREAAALPAALKEAGGHGGEIIIERYIPGAELTVAVLGRQALPAVEIIPAEGFYDYQAKYQSSATRYETPARLSPDMAARLGDLAVRAVDVLGCRGAPRCDFRVDPEGAPFLLEVNTIPGMTDHSLLPKAALAAGLSYDELVERIVREAGEAQ